MFAKFGNFLHLELASSKGNGHVAHVLHEVAKCDETDPFVVVSGVYLMHSENGGLWQVEVPIFILLEVGRELVHGPIGPRVGVHHSV